MREYMQPQKDEDKEEKKSYFDRENLKENIINKIKRVK